MSKKMCKSSEKDRKKEQKKTTKFECRSCGRPAKKKKKLCKPQKI
jgi:hypothetical protein